MHALTARANGFVEHAYAGEAGWTGLGNQIAPDASIEEIITAAGFDWRIERSKVRYCASAEDANNPAAWLTVPDRCVLRRDDTNAALGIVSTDYKPVQPPDYMRYMVTMFRNAGIEFNTAATVYDGRKMFISGAIGAESTVADPKDAVKAYLMTCTACDGSMATEWRYVMTRTVCNNTMEYARAEGMAKFKVTHRSVVNPERVAVELGLEKARMQFADTVAELRRLADTAIDDKVALYAAADLFVPDFRNMSAADQIKAVSRNGGTVADIGRLALDRRALGSELGGVSGTAWGWLNAVTEYVDHHANTRGDNKADNRFNSAMFGRGALVKQQAMTMATAMADHYSGRMPTQQDVATCDGSDILGSLLGKPARALV